MTTFFDVAESLGRGIARAHYAAWKDDPDKTTNPAAAEAARDMRLAANTLADVIQGMFGENVRRTFDRHVADHNEVCLEELGWYD